MMKEAQLLFQGGYLLSVLTKQIEELAENTCVLAVGQSGVPGRGLRRQAQSWRCPAEAGQQVLLVMKGGNERRVAQVI